MRKLSNSIILSGIVTIGVAITGFITLPGQQGMTYKEVCFQRIAEWSKGLNAIFMEDPFSSVIGEERLQKIDELSRKLLVPLGVQALPYLLVVYQFEPFIGGAIYEISKFMPHDIVLSRSPRNLLSTTEEFPEVIEKDISCYPAKIYLYWWFEGEKRMAKWFTERYTQWLVFRQQGGTNEIKEATKWLDLLNNRRKRGKYILTPYQKLLDIGIAAIPLWLEKLKSEKDAGVQQAIKQALYCLTGGEVNTQMTVEECLNWWLVNREKWTIPFPKDKSSFLNWLEIEAWNEEKRWGYPYAIVTTISRLEGEGAIEALIRLLRHPHPMVRGRCMEQLQKLFGEQLPKQYSLGAGTEEWERVGDLIEAGKYDLVKKQMKAVQERVKDLNEAEKVANELSDWWMKSRGKLTIYWQRAWENL